MAPATTNSGFSRMSFPTRFRSQCQIFLSFLVVGPFFRHRVATTQGLALTHTREKPPRRSEGVSPDRSSDRPSKGGGVAVLAGTSRRYALIDACG